MKKNKVEKYDFIVAFNGKKYRVKAKDRNEVTSKLAYVLDVPIRSLYGKISVFKLQPKKREYVVINRNKEEVFKGKIGEVADYLDLSVNSIYKMLTYIKKRNDYWNKKRNVIVCHVEDKDYIMKTYKFNEKK